MIKKIFLSTLNATKSFITGIKNLPSKTKEQIDNIKNNFSSLRHCLKNLVSSNMDLGIYHLYNRNYNDAIFRFKLINIFLEPENKEAYCWLGWAYFLKNNHKKAIISLTKAEGADKTNLLNFVKSIDSATHTPDEIYQIHRNINAELFKANFINDKTNLPKQLTLSLSDNISDLPKEYKILELGSNMGLLGYELNKRMQTKFELTGVEISNLMIRLQDEYFPKEKLYDSISHESINDFLANNKQSYDIICSLHGFNFKSDLQDVFDKVFAQLQKNGYFAFTSKLSKTDSFSCKTLEFSYNHEHLKEKLIQAGFQILSDDKFALEIKNNYSIFVCRK